ncbi:D-alanyl-D-alanine carboxypeptidase/D-alanyl-D-alanine-endopeptidase [bacterium]|nr:MAG: D-alanyl-D-alanine carboxypeptidase/D-alanyl-D-alanine-endopeptidase [bacterium]
MFREDGHAPAALAAPLTVPLSQGTTCLRARASVAACGHLAAFSRRNGRGGCAGAAGTVAYVGDRCGRSRLRAGNRLAIERGLSRESRAVTLIAAAALTAVLLARAPSVDAAVQRTLSEPALAGAHVGVAVVDPHDGALLYGHDVDGEYLPASTLKLLTSATALAVLGPDARPRTQLVYDGETLALIGGGDPLLAERDLDAAASAVAAAGVTEVHRLAVDQSYYAGPVYPAGWSWDDLAAYFAPPVTALSLEENALDVDIAPGSAVGDPADVRVEEAYAGTLYANAAATGVAGSPATADCMLVQSASAVRIAGSVPLGSAVIQQGCAVLDPSTFAAAVLTGSLKARGVQVDAIADAAAAPAGARTLWAHDGASVAELIAKMLAPSDNFIADELCRWIAKRRDPTGSFVACARAQSAYAASLGIDPHTLSLHDGSGLSRYDLLTPRDLGLLLAAIARGPDAAVVRGALPRPGREGTLAHRFEHSPAAARIAAKTGSMDHVDDLAGYVQTADRGELAFVVLVQGFANERDRMAVRLAAERIVEAIAAL